MHCRRVTEAMQDRDVRLADLQSKIEQLSRAKERAVQDNGSEVASLEVKLVGFIKDNSELLRANKWVSFGGFAVPGCCWCLVVCFFVGLLGLLRYVKIRTCGRLCISGWVCWLSRYSLVLTLLFA